MLADAGTLNVVVDLTSQAEVERRTPSEKPPDTQGARVRGIDSLRFILASMVVLSHTGFVPGRELLLAIHAPASLVELMNVLFNGVAAVMAFFIISGFCIHISLMNQPKIALGPYLIRREVRILPPVIVMIVLSALTKDWLFVAGTWSLICEEFYYLGYPYFRKWIAGRSFLYLFGGSMVCWIAIVSALPHRELIWSQGPLLTCLLCSPVWLLGARLAECTGTGASLLPQYGLKGLRPSIWFVRLASFMVALVFNIMRQFHVSEQITMIPFGLGCALWIEQEIANFRLYPPLAALERAGMASYSLYVAHPWILPLAWNLKRSIPRFNNRAHEHFLPFSIWILAILAIAILTTLMYALVERPSHRLAKYLGRAAGPRPTITGL